MHNIYLYIYTFEFPVLICTYLGILETSTLLVSLPQDFDKASGRTKEHHHKIERKTK